MLTNLSVAQSWWSREVVPSHWILPVRNLAFAEIHFGRSISSSAVTDMWPTYTMEVSWDPFWSDTILEKVFEFCPANVLARARLVSKRWNDRSAKSWRKKAVVKLTDEIQSVNWLHINQLQTLQETREEVLHLRRNPYRRCNMDANLVSSTSPIMNLLWPNFESMQIFEGLLVDVAAHVIPKATALRELVLQTPIMPPNEWRPQTSETEKNETLRTLVIDEADIWPRNTWTYILLAVPNLRKLVLDVVPSDAYGCLTDMLRSIIFCRDRGTRNLANLSELTVNGRGISHFAQAITDCNLRLTKISLDHVGEKAALCKLLRSQRINVLALEDYQHFPNWQTSLEQECEMERDEYRLWSRHVFLPFLTTYDAKCGLFNAMYFLRNLNVPQLRSIVVRIHDMMSDDERERAEFYERMMTSHECFTKLMSHILLRNVTRFEYINHSNPMAGSVIEILALSLPGVTNLAMTLTKASIHAVYKSWPNLESLRICGSMYRFNVWDDGAFIGKDSKAGKDDGTCSPNLRNLQNLRELVMDRTMLHHPSRVTDETALNGLLMLPKLTKLYFTFTELSSETLTMLQKHVRVLKIPFHI